MTTPTPIDITEIVPSKAKAWVGLVGSLLTFIGPAILTATEALPAPWPLVVGLVFAALTWLGIYKAPYKPVGTTLAPDTPAVQKAIINEAYPYDGPVVKDPAPTATATKTYRNPWRR